MKTETWLPVPGYEGRYSVSDMGEVMSMNFGGAGLLKILQPDISRTGYRRVLLYRGSKKTRKQYQVHALVMFAFVGPRPKGMQINHKNGDKSDNRLSNLEYCTALQNLQHALDTGLRRNLFGEDHSRAKLTNEQVVEIKRKLAAGVKQKLLAVEYSVSTTTICLIANEKHWSHIGTVQ